MFLAAGTAAREHGHHYLRPEHLVLGLLSQPDELAGRALAELGVTPEARGSPAGRPARQEFAAA